MIFLIQTTANEGESAWKSMYQPSQLRLLMRVKFPPCKNNEADVSSVGPWSQRRQRANALNVSFIITSGWKFNLTRIYLFETKF